MKRNILTALGLLMLGAATSGVAEAATRLVVWTTEGTKVAYELATEPKLSFDNENLVVKMGDSEAYLPLATLSHFTYEQYDELTAVDRIDTDRRGLNMADGALVLTLGEGRNLIEVYTPAGILVSSKTVEGVGEYTLPLADLEAGYYLVKVNDTTHKVLKR